MSMPEEFTRAVGHRIRRLREERGWSQEQLAKRAAIDRSQICRYENGRYLPNAITLVRLADELGVTTDELLGLTPGDVSQQFEDWLLRFPSLHHVPMRNLMDSYLKTNRLGSLTGPPSEPIPH